MTVAPARATLASAGDPGDPGEVNRLIRASLGVLVVAAASLAAMPSARADYADVVAGQFDVRYEVVTSNCGDAGLALTKGTLVIEKRKPKAVAIEIAGMAAMSGSANKGGRVKATAKRGQTATDGVDVRSSIAGTIGEDGTVHMVLVAEYYVDLKPSCTQAWDVTGSRQVDATQTGP